MLNKQIGWAVGVDQYLVEPSDWSYFSYTLPKSTMVFLGMAQPWLTMVKQYGQPSTIVNQPLSTINHSLPHSWTIPKKPWLVRYILILILPGRHCRSNHFTLQKCGKIGDCNVDFWTIFCSIAPRPHTGEGLQRRWAPIPRPHPPREHLDCQVLKAAQYVNPGLCICCSNGASVSPTLLSAPSENTRHKPRRPSQETSV